MIVTIDGVKIINATPHDIIFVDANGNDVVVPKCGKTLPAQAIETPAGTYVGAALVRTVFAPTDQALSELRELEEAFGKSIIVGSMISAQAFPGRVVALVPVPGLERATPEKKRYLANKFTTFEVDS